MALCVACSPTIQALDHRENGSIVLRLELHIMCVVLALTCLLSKKLHRVFSVMLPLQTHTQLCLCALGCLRPASAAVNNMHFQMALSRWTSNGTHFYFWMPFFDMTPKNRFCNKIVWISSIWYKTFYLDLNLQFLKHTSFLL